MANIKIITDNDGQILPITRDSAVLDENGVGINNSYQKQLVSGTNIKTINNQSILGSGNISISGGGGSSDAVLYIQQTLTTAQQTQARKYRSWHI